MDVVVHQLSTPQYSLFSASIIAFCAGYKTIKIALIGFPIISSLCKFCTNCRFRKFLTIKDIFQVLCHNASVHIKKLANCLLCQPYVMILHTDFNAFLV